MIGEILVLRLIHVLGGIFWVGSGLFSTFFLLPALAGAGPAAGAVMGQLHARRIFVVMPLAALLTILSGIRLMWIFSANFSADYFATRTGQALTISGAAALVAFLVGMVVSRPMGPRMAALRAQMTSADESTRAGLAAELERMQGRMSRAGTAATALVVFSAAGMAVARYLG